MSGTTQKMGVDLFAEFASKVVSRLPRDLDPKVAQRWIEDPTKLARVLREALMSPKQSNGIMTYPIFVNYGRTLEEMVLIGEYDWSNADITSVNFPTKTTGQADLIIELTHFNRSISTEDALKELDRMGYRPTELHELLAFGARYPEIQREFPVVALGSVWQESNCRPFCVHLHGHSWERRLILGLIDGNWLDVCRFAVVRK